MAQVAKGWALLPERPARTGCDQALVKHGKATSAPVRKYYIDAMQRALSSIQLLVRAEEALSVASAMQDEHAKRGMLGIAAGYQRLAEHVDAIASAGISIEMDPPGSLDA